MGLSYPTVKNKLQRLKTLVAGNQTETGERTKSRSYENSSIMEILEAIELIASLKANEKKSSPNTEENFLKKFQNLLIRQLMKSPII